MDTGVVVAIGILALFALLAARVPIAFALVTAGFLGTILLQGQSVAASALARIPFQAPSSYVLIVVPMFIAMGIFASRGSIAEDAYALAARLLRRVPGGLAVASVLGCAGFAAVSGSSVATVVTLGPVATKEMKAHGYDSVVSAGVVGAAGTLGVLIPPSIVLVLYGIVTGESIGQLLVAGIVPGVISAATYALALLVRARRHPDRMGGTAPVRPSSTAAARVLPVASLAKLVVLFVVVIGGIYSGVMSATEAASVGAAIALVFYLVGLRRAPWRRWRTEVGGAFGEATRLTSMAFALVVGSAVFTYFLVAAGVPKAFAGWIVGADLPPVLVVVLLLLAFVPLGMFLDPLSTLLIAVPLVHPVVAALGYDGLWFGILVVKMIEIGLITPPLGANAFVLSGAVEDVSVEEAFRGVLWFLPIDIATVAAIFAFPALVTWLPSLTSA